jgi:excisionase family DNA binding protein
MKQPMTTSAAARALGVSEATVRALERAGKLPAERTSTGTRIFKAEDVARAAEARVQRDESRDQ